MFAMVDGVLEVTVSKSRKYGEYGLCEHFLFTSQQVLCIQLTCVKSDVVL